MKSATIEQHELTRKILMDLTEILPEVNASGENTLGEKLETTRAMARRLVALGPSNSQIIAGYRQDAVNQILWLAERFFNTDTNNKEFSEEDLKLLRFACNDLAAKLAQYEQVKTHIESGEFE